MPQYVGEIGPGWGGVGVLDQNLYGGVLSKQIILARDVLLIPDSRENRLKVYSKSQKSD